MPYVETTTLSASVAESMSESMWAMAQSAVQAVLLARRGFTGPAGMIDGHDGLIEVMMGGRYDLETKRASPAEAS